VDAELVVAATRRAVEKEADRIARGEADKAAVLAHALDCFRDKVTHSRREIRVKERERN